MTIAGRSLQYWLAVGWTIAIFVACSLPGNGKVNLTNSDKWNHAGVFFVFGILWVNLGRRPGLVILAGIAYGMLIEVWQGIMPIGRTFDWYDGLADAVGVVVGVGVALLAERLRNRRS
ncbi:VanZ family protein [Rudanella paleaurantiibacter]|uniref:VanZ family protein n=1 Tax=Rudanella paleaurantiibacter TaxID=2614655 RepID=A0A7J5U4B2_9BACT|nr:VanZ family protein [Rudanella paleaurantiibacter]KAB7732679.1 VanZ family protein [Rudanella paleaurantiibacter]